MNWFRKMFQGFIQPETHSILVKRSRRGVYRWQIINSHGVTVALSPVQGHDSEDGAIASARTMLDGVGAGYVPLVRQ